MQQEQKNPQSEAVNAPVFFGGVLFNNVTALSAALKNAPIVAIQNPPVVEGTQIILPRKYYVDDEKTHVVINELALRFGIKYRIFVYITGCRTERNQRITQITWKFEGVQVQMPQNGGKLFVVESFAIDEASGELVMARTFTSQISEKAHRSRKRTVDLFRNMVARREGLPADGSANDILTRIISKQRYQLLDAPIILQPHRRLRKTSTTAEDLESASKRIRVEASPVKPPAPPSFDDDGFAQYIQQLSMEMDKNDDENKGDPAAAIDAVNRAAEQLRKQHARGCDTSVVHECCARTKPAIRYSNRNPMYDDDDGPVDL